MNNQKEILNTNKNKLLVNNSKNTTTNQKNNFNTSNFSKTQNIITINSLGKQPLLIYKKSPKKPSHSYDKKMKNQMKNFNDGGLKKKSLKHSNFALSNRKNKKNSHDKNNCLSAVKKSKKNNKVNNVNLKNKKKMTTSNKKPIIKNKTEYKINDNEIYFKEARNNIIKTPLYLNSEDNRNIIKNNYILNEDSQRYRNKLLDNIIKNTRYSKEKSENKFQKKLEPKDYFTQRKKIILQNYGIDYTKDDNDINGGLTRNVFKKGKKNISKNNKNNKLVKSTQISQFKGKNALDKINDNEIQTTKKSQIIKNKNNFNIGDDNSKNIKQLNNKPQIDQFEYLFKILNLKKNFKNKLKNKLDLINLGKNSKTNPTSFNNQIDSFQHKISKNSSSTSEEIEDEYPFAQKKSRRSKKEIKLFVKEQRIKEKKINKRNEMNKEKKLFIKYQKLCELHIENRNFLNGNSPNSKIKKRLSSNKHCKSRMELNEYYSGVSKSTIIDEKGFYLNILESQKIIVNKPDKNTFYLKLIKSSTNYDINKNNDFNESEVHKKNKKEGNKLKENKKSMKDNNNDKSKEKNVDKEKFLKGFSQKFELSNNKATEIEKKDDMYNIFDKKNIIKSMNIKGQNEDLDNLIKTEENEENHIINLNLDEQKKSNEKNENTVKININTNINKIMNKENKFNNDNDKKDILKQEYEKTNENNDNKKIEEQKQNEEKSEEKKEEKKEEEKIEEKKKIFYEPNKVVILMESIKLKIRKKIFKTVIKKIVNVDLLQHYYVAFSFFILICKQYSFKKIREYCMYKLFNTEMLQRKIFALVEFLSNFYKMKILEKIFNRSQRGYFKETIAFIMKSLIKPHLKKAFENLKNIEIINKANLEQNEKVSQQNLNEKSKEKIDLKKDQKLENIKKVIFEAEQNKNKELEKEVKKEVEQKLKEAELKIKEEEIKKKDQQLNEKAKQKDNIKAKLDIGKQEIIEDEKDEINNKQVLNILEKENKNENNQEIKYEELSCINILHQIKKNTETQNIKKENNQNEIENKKQKEQEKSKNANQKIDKIPKNENVPKNIDDNIIKSYMKNELKEEIKPVIDIVKEKNHLEIKSKEQNIPEKNIEEIITCKNTLNQIYNNFPIIKNEKKDDITIKILDENDSNLKKNENKIYHNELNNDSDITEKNILENNEKKLVNKEIDIKTNSNINVENRYKSNNYSSYEENNIINVNDNESNNSNEEEININLIQLKLKNKPEELSEKLTNEIINNILFSEIKELNLKIIPNKSVNNQIFNSVLSQSVLSNSESNNLENSLKKELISSVNSLEDSLSSSLGDSIISTYTNFSIFNKTIKDKKRENSLNFYIKSVAPRLIKLIRKEIFENYNRIYNNISKPIINNSSEVMVNLYNLKDEYLFKQNKKFPDNIEKISDIINKDKILKKFEPINKKLRIKDNLINDNYYDNFLNECIIEAVIDIIEGERLYGKNGEPLKWSQRLREISLKYDKNNPKKLADFVTKKLIDILGKKIGILSENYDNLNADQINEERKKRLIKLVKTDLEESDNLSENLELIETKLKIKVADIILDRVIYETVEILEHIKYKIERPDLYQYKSIYACTKLPQLKKLQRNNNDNKIIEKNEEDIMNI